MALTYWGLLDRRRKAVRMSLHALSIRSGVPLATVKRILEGRAENPTLRNLRAISTALGVSLSIGETIRVVEQCTATELRERAATEKAKQLVRLVQGISALESQAVAMDQVNEMVQETVHHLMAGSSRRIWSP